MSRRLGPRLQKIVENEIYKRELKRVKIGGILGGGAGLG